MPYDTNQLTDLLYRDSVRTFGIIGSPLSPLTYLNGISVLSFLLTLISG